MLDLSNVTLVAMTTQDYASTRRAIDKCLSVAKFYSVMVFTNEPKLFFGFDTINIPNIETWEDASIVGLKTITSYARDFADYTLGIQWDGFIVNPSAWKDEFFDYDFIGAPWPDGVVGNNGFCLCSRKWYSAVESLQLEPTLKDCHPADAIVCRFPNPYNGVGNGQFRRQDMLDYGIKYAPEDVARKFSVENETYTTSFGFHGKNTLIDLYRKNLI